MPPHPHEVPTPNLTVDLATVRARYRALRAALPRARVLYAVKANPQPEVVGTLAAAGSGFDVASPGEIDLVLAHGAAPETLCFGNPVKKPADVAAAARAGVGLFVTDSREDLAVIAACAPGAAVLVRIAVDDAGSATPFDGKFGCAPAEAVELLAAARRAGLQVGGLSFHVGSQQHRPDAWSAAIAAAARVAERAATPLPLLNLGGGFPVGYREPVRPLGEYRDAIGAAVRRHFGADRVPELAVEPGRLLVAEAGTLVAEVVRVTRRADGRRWVYLDIGRYGGLAETEGEAIGYRVATAHDGSESGPAVLAGPTCDGDDVLYREIDLPLRLRSGDRVELLAAGAYTASYASVGFNGLPPLSVRCIDSDTEAGDTEAGDTEAGDTEADEAEGDDDEEV